MANHIARLAPRAGVPGGAVDSDGGEFGRTYASLVEKADHLRILHELAIALLAQSKLDDILWEVARTAIGGLGFEDCVIYLLDEQRGVLEQKAAYGPKNPVANEILSPIEIPLGKGIVGTVAATGQSELVSDTREDPRYILDDEMRNAELAVPIVHEDKVIGVIDSEHHQVAFYTESHREILTTIASMASTKIASAVTIERLNQTVHQLELTKAALLDGEQRYRMLYDHHPSMFFTLDRAGVVQSANTFASEQLGYGVDELVGMSIAQLSPPEEGEKLTRHLRSVFGSSGKPHRWESIRLTNDGERIHVRETARIADFQGEDSASVLVVSEDVSDAYALAQELEYQASHDALTGLHNRREFELRARRTIQEARVEGSEHVLWYLDLDKFKIINDTCGHVAGDELLRQLAALLRARLRKSDVIARIGGDEFGVLMPHCTMAGAEGLAEEVVASTNDLRFQWDNQLFRVGVSVGLVAIDRASGSFSEVLACADSACYAAKEAGGNRSHVYAPDDETLLERDREMRSVVRISDALERDLFELYYQPIRAIQPGADSDLHFEVLVRLKSDHTTELPLLPDAFLPAAERYGLSTELDRWVLSHALDWLAANPGVVDRMASCSLNLSGPSLADDRIVDFVTAALERTGVPADKLCFEITETTAVGNLVNARTFIESMKHLGCRFALDDFGSGLSSFAYLTNLPVDVVKIDGAFVRTLPDNPVDQEIVRSIHEIARAMGKVTVAEFVGNEAALGVLSAIGVDYAQGNLIGVPRPLSDLTVR